MRDAQQHFEATLMCACKYGGDQIAGRDERVDVNCVCVRMWMLHIEYVMCGVGNCRVDHVLSVEAAQHTHIAAENGNEQIAPHTGCVLP